VHPDAEAVARFNALVHELYRDAPQVDAARSPASRAGSIATADQRESLLTARLQRIEELEAMRRDATGRSIPRRSTASTWCCNTWRPRTTSSRQHADLRLPRRRAAARAGLAVFAEDVDDYRDFRQFREESATASGRARTSSTGCAHAPRKARCGSTCTACTTSSTPSTGSGRASSA
jgi:hypothetical protein